MAIVTSLLSAHAAGVNVGWLVRSALAAGVGVGWVVRSAWGRVEKALVGSQVQASGV